MFLERLNIFPDRQQKHFIELQKIWFLSALHLMVYCRSNAYREIFTWISQYHPHFNLHLSDFPSKKHKKWKSIKWASMWENLSSGGCEQQRCRPAWAYLQSDQRLWHSLLRKLIIKTCYKQNFTILASLCSQAGWSGYDLGGNPKDRF